jgi:hypothetical protein
MLIEIWKAAKETVLKMNLEQIVSNAGNLKDGSQALNEFRQFLQEVESHKLSEYANFCVSNKDYGEILQEVVNEIGRRLGFLVENGLHKGKSNAIGYDGIWTSNNENFVIEVKTTAAYTINLDVIATYRAKLANTGKVKSDSPILLVIGRDNTEALEAQVRGSRYAWSIRIIGIDALIKLMEVNLTTSSKDVTEKIHAILKPIEYTRIDKIVDVIFTAAEDKEEINILADFESQENKKDKTYSSPQVTQKEIIEIKKQEAIDALSKKINRALIKKKNSLFSDPNNENHAVVSLSKRYIRSEDFYWYAYHEVQRQFLSESKNGFMVFAMADLDFSFAIPYTLLEDLRDKLNSTVRKNGTEYKHIFLYIDKQKFTLRLKAGEAIDISQYKIS